jgi:drug/metabolite transporter (DMT)-like permease
LVIIIGIYLIYRFETRYYEGIFFALLASVLATLFSVMNKNISLIYEPRVIAFWEMLSGFAVVSAFILLSGRPEGISLLLPWQDLLYLLILGVVCTAIAFAETVSVMKKLSAYVVVLVINLETIYGIVLGLIIFGDSEKMTAGFYSGALLLLAAVFAYPFLKRRFAHTEGQKKRLPG